MYLMVTVDANRGMEFNHRPVSRDARLTELMEEDKKRHAAYWPDEVGVINPPPESIQWSQVTTVYLYNFNRVYPADVYFKFPANKQFVLQTCGTFKGNSHIITKEVYKKWSE